MLKLVIPGEPVAKGRPRVTKWGTYTPEKTKNYETLVKELFFIEHGQTLLEGQLKIDIKAYFSIPKSASKKKKQLMLEGELRPTKKPDADNILKIIGDALNDLAYKDDKQIVSANIEKFYSDEPRVQIEIKNKAMHNIDSSVFFCILLWIILTPLKMATWYHRSGDRDPPRKVSVYLLSYQDRFFCFYCPKSGLPPLLLR